MTFGRMPLANAFVTADDMAAEEFYALEPAFCERCGTFQLTTQPPPARLFKSDYPFRTGSSTRMVAHFSALAATLRQRLSALAPFVVEIGANDGTLLEALASRGCRCVGVDPVEQCVQLVRRRGLEVVHGFFGADLADRIASERGRADAVVAANVICHIPDIHSLAEGITRLLRDDGLFVFEDPYLGDLLRMRSYDQIYDEHVFVWSATSVRAAFGRHGLDLIDVEPLGTHGGSLRYTLARRGAHAPSARVQEWLAREKRAAMGERRTYDQFRRECEVSRDALRNLLEDLRSRGRRVDGYAATSKSTTVLNYGGIDGSLIARIYDSTPAKQGKFTPGTHIPIVPSAQFAVDPPEFAVLFAWIHAEEILDNERAFAAGGGRWIRFVPDVRILD